MAKAILHHDGTIEVVEPPTPSEQAEAEEALSRVIRALVRMAAEEERLASTDAAAGHGATPSPTPD